MRRKRAIQSLANEWTECADSVQVAFDIDAVYGMFQLISGMGRHWPFQTAADVQVGKYLAVVTSSETVASGPGVAKYMKVHAILHIQTLLNSSRLLG